MSVFWKLCLLFVVLSHHGGWSEEAPPNLLILIADDLGWNDVGFHSGAGSTPHLDDLAKQSLELGRFYVYPYCSPTRAALLTGLIPQRFGLNRIVGKGQSGPPRGTLTLPDFLGEHGYQTALIGKWHLGRGISPREFGFDHFYGFIGAEINYFEHTAVKRGQVDWQRNGETVREEGYSTYLLADEAIRLLKARDRSRPFFYQVAFNAPHIPLAAPDDLATDEGLYAAVIKALDFSFGRILTELEDLGLDENTLVVFFSDNGADLRHGDNSPFRAGKTTLFEGGIRTPCVMRWPGHLPSGEVLEQPISAQDLFPTLISALGLQVPESVALDGIDLWQNLRDHEVGPRKPILIVSDGVAMIDGDWKLIEKSSGEFSMFDLAVDPEERTDLFDVEEMSKVLKVRLEQSKIGLPSLVPSDRPKKGEQKKDRR